jgi:hypothetical protein
MRQCGSAARLEVFLVEHRSDKTPDSSRIGSGLLPARAASARAMMVMDR